MSKKRLVSLDDEFTGLLFGLVAPVKEYQLSWHLNRTLGLDLKRGDDLEIINRKKSKTSVFSFYKYRNEIDKWMVCAISNKHLGEFLIPEVKQADYFFMIRGEVSEMQSEEIHQKIKNIPVIQLVVKLDYERLKSKANLIVD